MSKTSARKRAAELSKQRQRRRRLVNIGAISIGVVLLVGIIALAVKGPDLPGEAVSDLGNVHLNDGETFDGYNTIPPTSGPHYGNLAPWGIHTESIPDQLQIHNLEDGGVGVQYYCPEGCPELVAELTTIVGQYDDRVFMAPYDRDFGARIALTAWTRIEKLDEFDAAAVRRFIEAYRGLDHHRRFG